MRPPTKSPILDEGPAVEWMEADRFRLPRPLSDCGDALGPAPLIRRTGTLIRRDPSGVALVRRDDSGGQIALASGSWRLLRP